MKLNCLLTASYIFLVWGIITLTINSANAFDYRLQNATVAALVNRSTFTLKELEVPDFRLIVGQETFRIGENVYPMKQPGQTIYGSFVYAILQKLGINFDDQYMLTSQLITMYSSAFLVSIASYIIFSRASKISSSKSVGLFSGLIFVFGTIVWPYAGVTHHDILGLFLIVFAVDRYLDQKNIFWASIAATFSLFFTMLTLPIVLVLHILNWRNKWTWIGSAIGLLPTIIFNILVYDKFWLVSNLAGKVSDTVPLLSLVNLGQKLIFYLVSPNTSIWAFSPVLLFGLIGLYLIPKSPKKIPQIMILPVVMHILYISSMETFGGYQFGARYLLPIIPFLTLGIAHFYNIYKKILINPLFAISAIYSIGVSTVGSLTKVMNPIDNGYIPFASVKMLYDDGLPVMRVWKYGAAMILLSMALFFVNGYLRRKKVESV